MSWTSNGRMPSARTEASRATANASSRTSSSAALRAAFRSSAVDALQSLRDPRPELVRPGAEGLVRELLHLGLEGVDPRHARRELLEVALVLRAEDLGEDAVDHIWAVNI